MLRVQRGEIATYYSSVLVGRYLDEHDRHQVFVHSLAGASAVAGVASYAVMLADAGAPAVLAR